MLRPLHGWGISKRIQLLSDDVLSVQQGSLYPALHRLEQQGWITAEWKDTDLGRPSVLADAASSATGLGQTFAGVTPDSSSGGIRHSGPG